MQLVSKYAFVAKNSVPVTLRGGCLIFAYIEYQKFPLQLLTHPQLSDIIYTVENTTSPAEVVEWQTRYFEVVVSVWLMRVQVPSSAPGKARLFGLFLFTELLKQNRLFSKMVFLALLRVIFSPCASDIASLRSAVLLYSPNLTSGQYHSALPNITR